jgi:hypothetical protein
MSSSRRKGSDAGGGIINGEEFKIGVDWKTSGAV